MTMTIEKMEKVSNWLTNATPEQLQKMAEDMAENAPNLYAGLITTTPQERAVSYIKLNIASIDNALTKLELESLVSYAQAVIDTAHLLSAIDAIESENYHSQIVQIKEQTASKF